MSDTRSFILRRGLSGKDGKVGMLVFGESATPELYVKIARFKGENERIRKEKEVLDQVRLTLKNSPLLESVPKIIFFEKKDGRDVLGLEGKPGFVMLSEIFGQGDRRQERSLKFLKMGFSWLSEFRKTGWAHGDFCPKNLLVDSGRLNVVDWEYAFPNAKPTFDLFYFCLKFGFWLFGQGQENGRRYAFLKTFLEENWFSHRVKKELLEFGEFQNHFLEPLEFQAVKEEERTGIKDNFWIDLLNYGKAHEEEIL